MTGCGNKPSRLVLTAEQSQRQFATTFNEAWFARSDEGSLDIVLVSDPLTQARDAKPGQALRPLSAPPIRHVVHVHVLWQPIAIPSYENPAITNSSIHWYVMGRGTGPGTDMVRYDGAGFVSVRRGSRQAKLEIRTADLRPTIRAGALADPIGPSDLTGQIVARHDPAKVESILASVDGAVATVAGETTSNASE